MINSGRLYQRIADQGYTLQGLANLLDISTQELQRKIYNRLPFEPHEIDSLAILLAMDDPETYFPPHELPLRAYLHRDRLGARRRNPS